MVQGEGGNEHHSLMGGGAVTHTAGKGWRLSLSLTHTYTEWEKGADTHTFI